MKSANSEPAEAGDDRSPVAVEGRERVVVSGAETESFSRASRVCTVECASGERATDEWCGVPLGALADAADFPGETTHLRIEADDFAAEIPIRPALGGILAFDRRDGRDDAETGLPRFVADGVDGERLVKRVCRISAVALDPDEDPQVG